MTELVIRTIHRNTHQPNFRLVVLDNASESETQAMLEELHQNGLIDELIQIKTNLGLEAARNLLLKNATQSDYFVCVDNDCLPQKMIDGKDWLEELYDLLEKYEDYAAISARTQVMIGTGNIFEEADKNGDDIVDFPHPGGSYRIMNTKRTILAGGWDRGMAGRGQEEEYICGRLRDMGFKTAFATDVHCLHLWGPKETTDRWGYPIDFKPEDTGHSDISHPALDQGDVKEELLKYASDKDVERYYA